MASTGSENPSQGSSGSGQSGQSSGSNPSIPQVIPVIHEPGYANYDLQSGHVLLVVRQGPILEMVPDYKLAHIPITQVDDEGFFRMVRENYFRLRGFIRSWFSVWRYSHCDFYEVSDPPI